MDSGLATPLSMSQIMGAGLEVTIKELHTLLWFMGAWMRYLAIFFLQHQMALRAQF